MKFNYFYGNESEKYQFVAIPNLILLGKKFKNLSLSSKVLYGLLLSKTGLSRKNKWLDRENRVYIIYTIEDISEDLGVCSRTAMKLLRELEDFGLVEKQKRGSGLPSILYVKDFYKESVENRSAENDTSELYMGERNYTSEMSNNYTTDVQQNITSEVKKVTPHNYKENNHTYSDIPIYPSKAMDEIDGMRELLRQNIEYETLMQGPKHDREMVDEIVNLLDDMLLARKAEVKVGSAVYSQNAVRNRILKLNSEHIKYVIDMLKNNKREIVDIRSYLLTMLYNAPTTMESYFTAKASQYMNGGSDE